MDGMGDVYRATDTRLGPRSRRQISARFAVRQCTRGRMMDECDLGKNKQKQKALDSVEVREYWRR
jgi:hypothetical protein